MIDQPVSGPSSTIVTCSCGDCRNATATVAQAIVRAMTVSEQKRTSSLGSSPSALALLADGWRLQRMRAPRCEWLHTTMTFIIRSRAEPVTGRNSPRT